MYKYIVIAFFVFITPILADFNSEIRGIIDNANNVATLKLNDQHLKWLRIFCYGKEGELYISSIADREELKAKGLWALVLYEYSYLSIAYNDIDRQSTAWYLNKAHNTFHRYLEQGGFSKQETWALRLLLSSAYLRAVVDYLPAMTSRETVNEEVAKRLLEVFSPGSDHQINRDLINAYRNQLQSVQEKVQKYILVKSTIRSTVRQTYGRNPERQKYQETMPQSEFDLIFNDEIFAEVEKILEELPSSEVLGQSNNQPTTIVGNYNEMREKLEMPKEQSFADYNIDGFFNNTERESKIDIAKETLENKLNENKSEDNKIKLPSTHKELKEQIAKWAEQLGESDPDILNKLIKVENEWQKIFDSNQLKKDNRWQKLAQELENLYRKKSEQLHMTPSSLKDIINQENTNKEREKQ